MCERDDAVDDFYNSIFRALLTHMMENPHNIGQAAHLLFVAKNLERVGDHATNIAEMVYYAATGEHMAEPAQESAPEADMTPTSSSCWSRTTGRSPSLVIWHFEREDFDVTPHRRRRGGADPGRRGCRPTSSSSTG